ncbi:MAG: type II 3-dehydroquinate dehydratase [Culicoidibacterales bacterium]
MKILILNGPNLNLLGIREPEFYGYQTLADLEQLLMIQAVNAGIEVVFAQSNHEGVLIDWLHQAFFEQFSGVILNPGAYTHYSYAIRDAIASIPIPVVEVHLSDIASREAFRQHSVIAEVVVARFSGNQFQSYGEALQFLIERGNEE